MRDLTKGMWRLLMGRANSTGTGDRGRAPRRRRALVRLEALEDRRLLTATPMLADLPADLDTAGVYDDTAAIESGDDECVFLPLDETGIDEGAYDVGVEIVADAIDPSVIDVPADDFVYWTTIDPANPDDWTITEVYDPDLVETVAYDLDPNDLFPCVMVDADPGLEVIDDPLPDLPPEFGIPDDWVGICNEPGTIDTKLDGSDDALPVHHYSVTAGPADTPANASSDAGAVESIEDLISATTSTPRPADVPSSHDDSAIAIAMDGLEEGVTIPEGARKPGLSTATPTDSVVQTSSEQGPDEQEGETMADSGTNESAGDAETLADGVTVAIEQSY